jgi:hypothetical protein
MCSQIRVTMKIPKIIFYPLARRKKLILMLMETLASLLREVCPLPIACDKDRIYLTPNNIKTFLKIKKYSLKCIIEVL